ncbi:MAG: hypothetical protein M1823_002557 [Watsoniomyces obsoletus]|nr:MAG: hypothetical protein M1823_002557 [Watsoniomyces obsoletus]
MIGDNVLDVRIEPMEVVWTGDDLHLRAPPSGPWDQLIRRTSNGVWCQMKIWRALYLVTTWLGFAAQENMTAKEAQDFLLGHQMLAGFLERFRGEGPGFPTGSGAAGSSREKVSIFVALPLQQVLLVAALQEMGIHVVAYHAGLDQIDRADLAATVYNKVNQVHVLICIYQLISTGVKVARHCRNVILLESATSTPIEAQAIGRFRHIGQPYTASNSRKKAFPGIMADLNQNVWGVTAPDQDRLTLANFVLDGTRLVPATESIVEPPAASGELAILTPNELLTQIFEILTGNPASHHDT